MASRIPGLRHQQPLALGWLGSSFTPATPSELHAHMSASVSASGVTFLGQHLPAQDPSQKLLSCHSCGWVPPEQAGLLHDVDAPTSLQAVLASACPLLLLSATQLPWALSSSACCAQWLPPVARDHVGCISPEGVPPAQRVCLSSTPSTA